MRMRRLFRRMPGPRDCEEVRALFSGYADEELGEADRLRVDEHVGFCPPCRQVLGNLRVMLRRLRGLEAPPGTDEAAERLRQTWREQ